jgi:hypothetical protein
VYCVERGICIDSDWSLNLPPRHFGCSRLQLNSPRLTCLSLFQLVQSVDNNLESQMKTVTCRWILADRHWSLCLLKPSSPADWCETTFVFICPSISNPTIVIIYIDIHWYRSLGSLSDTEKRYSWPQTGIAFSWFSAHNFYMLLTSPKTWRSLENQE